MDCSFFEQPLNHFVPAGRSPTYFQRYCVYHGFVGSTARSNNSNNNNNNNETAHTYPIFFYTGNESPLEEYINHTGLMWESAPEFGASVVFAEHRYEGQSLPPANLTQDCMSYSSSKQAIADYVRLLGTVLNPSAQHPVIAFGGSYGGMLSSWMRIKYPNIVAGAVAGSAPIWALPRTRPRAIDTAYRVVRHGLSLPHPPNKHADSTVRLPSLSSVDDNHCGQNLLAAWPLIQFLGKKSWGRDLLTNVFRLCTPLQDVDQLLEWGQSPWFDLAEGSFPYPSSYITFALHMGPNPLPAWPVQTACWKASRLHHDYGVRYQTTTGQAQTDLSSVNYTIVYGQQDRTINTTAEEQELRLSIDWDNVQGPSKVNSHAWTTSPTVIGLLESVRDAVAVWYNVTQDLSCFNATPAINAERKVSQLRATHVLVEGTVTSTSRVLTRTTTSMATATATATIPPDESCPTKQHSEGSWPSLCCNEDMNLVVTYCMGLGHDVFWPPSDPRGTSTYTDIADEYTEGCPDPDGSYGYPAASDPWSDRLDMYYGGLRLQSQSNIVFSNGLLDPWSAGGVYAWDPFDAVDASTGRYTGPMVQNITDDGSMVALLIEFGGHHTDLMYSDKKDPVCVTEAREIEKQHMQRWIEEWPTVVKPPE